MAVKLMNEMVKNEQLPMCVVFTSWLDYSTRNFKDYKLLESIQKMLQFIADNDIKISRNVANKLIKVFSTLNWSGSYCYIGQCGKCKNCHQRLLPIMFSNEEFMNLREDFLARAMKYGSAFTKTTSDELEQYKCFIKDKAPFKIIIDGLYVAQMVEKISKPSDLINTIIAVVNHFARKGEKVLLLGRKNMTNWSERGFSEIEHTADIYLTENSCYDDPYLLYAALYSGPETNFLSKDLFNQSHVFIEKSLKLTFKKWQQKHQYQIISSDNGNVALQVPIIYWPSAHRTHNSWHVPYVEEYNSDVPLIKSAPTNWLCLHNKSLVV